VTKTVSQIGPERKTISKEKIAVLYESSVHLKIFDTLTIEFLDAVSKAILNSSQLNRIAEMAALGFWLRKANLSRFIRENQHITENKNCSASPLGMVFHVCPSNVETMFMYSCAIALLMGSKNVIRVSGREGSPYLDTLFDVINSVLAEEENKVFREYISIVTYGHDEAINEYFSMKADARIIWGGDETIKSFKALQTSPGTKDIVFADRVSYSLFKSSAYLSLDEKEKSEITAKFYNDSYSFNQKGCSCPQAVFMLGTNADNKMFEREFYERLKEVVVKKYNADMYSLASVKLNRLGEDAIREKISNVYGNDNRVVFAELRDGIDASGTSGGGLFYMKNISVLEQLLPYVNPKVQTLGYFGLTENEIVTLLSLTSGRGIDRLVPVGKALDFHYIWDGYNLFDELCCKRYVG
jgi:hypothetical protein